jgi:Trk K+ transport system NAD-binding subunit
MQASKPADIAITWLSDAGRNLAANLVEHGYSVAACDAFPEVLENARGVSGASLGLLDSLGGLSSR